MVEAYGVPIPWWIVISAAVALLGPSLWSLVARIEGDESKQSQHTTLD